MYNEPKEETAPKSSAPIPPEDEPLADFPTDLETLNERAEALKDETGGNFRRFMGCGG